VTAAASTVAFAGALVLTANVLRDCPRYPFDVMVSRQLVIPLGVDARLKTLLGDNTYYSKLFLNCTDNDVDSDVRIQDVSVVIDNVHRAIDAKLWGDIQADNRIVSGMQAGEAGFAVIEFDPHQIGYKESAWGRHSCDLLLNVPAGAAIAADRLFVTSEEIRLNPNRNEK
jgi:hypothetical protein